MSCTTLRVLLAVLVLLGGKTASAQTRSDGGRNAFVISAVVLAAATVADVESTMAGINGSAHEANPMMRWVVNGGRPSLYAFNAGIDTAIMLLARNQQKQGQRHWWVAPAIMTGTHGFAAGANIRVIISLP